MRWTGYLLHLVQNYASEQYHSRMAQLGLRPGQVGMLQLLAEDGPHVQARLADRLRLDKAAVVHYLNELENAKLVERRNHPDDRRAFLIFPTSAGLRILERAEELNAAISEELFGVLSSTENQQFHSLLRKIAEAQSLAEPAW